MVLCIAFFFCFLREKCLHVERSHSGGGGSQWDLHVAQVWVLMECSRLDPPQIAVHDGSETEET